jgi:hypothetical protein
VSGRKRYVRRRSAFTGTRVYCTPLEPNLGVALDFAKLCLG